MPKSKEQLEKEQKEAQEKLEQLLSTSRPKNLRQGVSGGVSNILTGALGAAGVAVLAPTMGFAMGLRGGGIVGGALGAAGGAVIGAVGGAAMLLGGTIQGVTQIVRGVAAVPEALTAPRQGKWWNSATHSWVLTDLSTVTVAENDDDLLKKIEDDLDASSRPSGATSGDVKDMYYYDILEVDPKADPSAIKRRYYVLARKYHPDKVIEPEAKKEAEAKFKDIAEAYQVLSDPQLREKYNKDGKDALSGDKTSANDENQTDPALLLAFLFGSDKFKKYIGRLATSTSAMLGDSPKLSIKDARTLQERRVTRLAQKLAGNIDPWVEGDFDMCKTMWKTEAEDLCKASYGWELVKVIGMAYEVTAVQFLGSAESGVGMPSIGKWAEGQKAGAKKSKAGNKNQFETLMATMDAMKIQAEYAEKINKAESDDEKASLQREMAEATTMTMLKIIWSTTSVDITSTIHETCQMVFFDQSVDKDVRKRRAHAVKNLGVIFQECTEPEDKKDGKTLYEEAALAAMLETIKRKDEETHSANMN